MIDVMMSDAQWNLILDLLQETRVAASGYKLSLIDKTIEDFWVEWK